MEELLFEEVTEVSVCIIFTQILHIICIPLQLKDGIVADLCLGMPHSRTSADMQELLTPQPVNV